MTRKENHMTTIESEPLEGELVPVDDHPSPATLFRSDEPELIATRATAVADLLARIIREQKLYATIQGKEYVLVEGWTLAGTLLGVFPVLVWTRKLDDGWEARVEARTRDGAIVGAAESECLRSERKWARAEDYAIRSMASTRATSKALRQPLGFVITLAGFEATPADEIPGDADQRRDHDQPAGAPDDDGGPIPPEHRPTEEQLDRIRMLLRRLAELDPQTDWKARARAIAVVRFEMLTRTTIKYVIEKLEAELGALVDGEER